MKTNLQQAYELGRTDAYKNILYKLSNPSKKILCYHGFIQLLGYVLIFLLILGFTKGIQEASASHEAFYKEQARLERLIECNKHIDLLDKYYLTNQDIGTRCATIRTLSKDYSPYENIMDNIHTPSKSDQYWEVYYDIKRIRIENNIMVNTTVEKKINSNYNDVEEAAFEMIKYFEGFHSCTYWDIKQYSNGYGTAAPKGECISEEIAKERAVGRINHIIEKYGLSDYSPLYQVSLVSFTYNLGTPPEGYKWYLDNGHNKALANLMKKYVKTCKYVDGEKKCKTLRGLVIRRGIETDPILNM